MSTFVELPPSRYSLAAFSNFDPTASDFSVGNARALMWVSQLAYETGKPLTIDAVGRMWNFTSVSSFIKEKVDIVASFDTTGILGERADAIILVFAGTDPAVWETLATDFNIRLRADTDTHIGFQAALDAARPEVDRAVTIESANRQATVRCWAQSRAALAALAARFAEFQWCAA